MATTALTTNDNQYNTNTTNLQNLSEDHPPIRRSSGRQKAKGIGEQKIKKEPQRGMGVEKLERLRQQEKWKQMAEIKNNPSIPFAPFQFPMSGPNPGHFGQMGQGYFYGVDQFHSTNDQLISSTPNALSQNCNTCHKKKRVSGENLGCGRAKNEVYNMQMGPIGECGFLGLSIGDNQNIINQENQTFATKPVVPLVPQVRYAVPKSHPGHVEVVAVHRKGSSSKKGSGVVMEYEFFPNGRSKKEKEESFNNDHDDLVMRGGTTSTTTTTSAEPCVTGFDAPTSIDLSLKLSY